MLPTAQTSHSQNFIHNLDTWAGAVAHKVDQAPHSQQKEALHNTIVKIARKESLNTDQVARLCEASNHKVYASMYSEDPESTYGMPVADKTAILADLLDGEEKTAGGILRTLQQTADDTIFTPFLHERSYVLAPVEGGGFAVVPSRGDYNEPPPKRMKKKASVDSVEAFGTAARMYAKQYETSPIPPVLTNIPVKEAALQEYRNHSQALDVIRSEKLALETDMQRSDDNIYNEIRKLIVEGKPLEDVFAYVGKTSPDFASGEGQRYNKIIDKLKSENLIHPEKEVEPNRIPGDPQPRVINKDTSLATSLGEDAEVADKHAQYSRAEEATAQKCEMLKKTALM